MTTTTTSPAATLTREYKGAVIPAPGVYDLDQAHTTVEFIARHLMITKVRGRFAGFSGSVTVAEVPGESSVEVTIDASSIDTSQDQRDAHLRSADFFDVETYPTLAFKSTSVELDGDDLEGGWRPHGTRRHTSGGAWTWSSTAPTPHRGAATPWPSRLRPRSTAKTGA